MAGKAPTAAKCHSPAGRALRMSGPELNSFNSISSPASLSHPFSLAYHMRNVSCSSSQPVGTLTSSAADAPPTVNCNTQSVAAIKLKNAFHIEHSLFQGTPLHQHAPIVTTEAISL